VKRQIETTPALAHHLKFIDIKNLQRWRAKWLEMLPELGCDPRETKGLSPDKALRFARTLTALKHHTGRPVIYSTALYPKVKLQVEEARKKATVGWEEFRRILVKVAEAHGDQSSATFARTAAEGSVRNLGDRCVLTMRSVNSKSSKAPDD
jgi:hypothetical protein